MSVLLLVQGSSPLPAPDASPAAYASDYSYYVPAAAPAPSHQYHAQDDIGQYNYGYQSADSAKSEVKTADGVVRGAYSYVDANGIVQTVNYISDALGFRVAATNLPVHHVGGATEAAAEAAPVEAAGYSVVNPLMANYAYLPYATGYNYHNLVAPVVPAVQEA